MSQEQQQLRFSVEESVWFQKGQEVSELLSISLDPDISIHEHDQYISIRGALQLTGEYKIDNEATSEDQNEYANVRYVNQVETGENGISVMQHRFPVDITIPNNRIDNLEEVFVSIDSFDYELPELKCLKLIADLSISGISSDQSDSVSAEVARQEEEFEPLYRGSSSKTSDREDERTAFPDYSTHPFSTFYQEPESSVDDVDKLPFDNAEENREEEIVNNTNEEQSTTQSLEEDDAAVEQEEQEEQEDVYDPFVVEVRKQEQQEAVNEPNESQEVQYSFFSKSEATESYEEQEDNTEEAIERDESDPKNAHYLTSLFARDEEEDFSRLKMCIVQQGDTVDLICERYDISVQQLLRVNDFHADQDVYEGQILYIPAYSTSTSS